MTDTLFADVSDENGGIVVDDSYPYAVLSFESNDGTVRQRTFAQNYRWAAAAADSGRLTCFIVFVYWHPNWQDCVHVMQDMVTAVGGPHPKMIVMMDVEPNDGNTDADQSDLLNLTYGALAAWLGNPKRVIGYSYRDGFNRMWPSRPPGMGLIVADYQSDPRWPGQLVHQYTDGNGEGAPLPQGAGPWGRCDMDCADGMSPAQFAAACGVDTADTGLTAAEATRIQDGLAAVCGPIAADVKDIHQQLGAPAVGLPELDGKSIVDTLAEVLTRLSALEKLGSAA